MADNRRSSTRRNVDIAARMKVGDAPEDCRVLNVSMGGVLVTCHKLPMGVRVTVWFRVPTLDQEIEASGIVRWSADEAIGVQFDGLRAKETWALGKFIESLGDKA